MVSIISTFLIRNLFIVFNFFVVIIFTTVIYAARQLNSFFVLISVSQYLIFTKAEKAAYFIPYPLHSFLFIF